MSGYIGPDGVPRPYITRPNDFNTGCYDCFQDPSSCFDTICCWHAQLTSQYKRLTSGFAGPDIGYCCGLFLADLCCWGIPSAVCTCYLRQAVRERYGIPCDCGEMVVDGLLYCCGCWCCMVCQQHREMHMRGEYPGGVCTNPDPRYAPSPRPMNVVVMTTTYSNNAIPNNTNSPYGGGPGSSPPPPPAYYGQPPYAAPVYGQTGTNYGYTNNTGGGYGAPPPLQQPYSPQGPVVGVPLQSMPQQNPAYAGDCQQGGYYT